MLSWIFNSNVLNNKQQTNINNSDKRQNLSSYEHNQINSNNLPAQNITAILEGDINEAGFMDDDLIMVASVMILEYDREM
jgi:hypothetical protein